MIIDCEHDPNDLIDAIGDRYFSIIEEESSDDKIRIRCCEDVILIEITTDEFGDASESAKALITLLNQEYTKVSG